MLTSGPSEREDVTVVLGANGHVLQGQRIISKGALHTNALAPLLRVLDDAFGVMAGHMATIQY